MSDQVRTLEPSSLWGHFAPLVPIPENREPINNALRELLAPTPRLAVPEPDQVRSRLARERIATAGFAALDHMTADQKQRATARLSLIHRNTAALELHRQQETDK